MATSLLPNKIQGPKAFDVDFELEKEKQKQLGKQNAEAKLATMTTRTTKPYKSLHEYTLYDVSNGFTSSWGDMYGEVRSPTYTTYTTETITKNHRIFFVGLTVLMLGLLLLLFVLHRNKQ